MSSAPERIWAKPGMPGYVVDGPCDGVYDVEYIRADVAAPKVNPLDISGNEIETIVGTYVIESGVKDKIGGDRWWRWYFNPEDDPFFMYQYGIEAESEAAAHDAINAHYKGLILSALEGE